jgi:hypothetical protein
LLAPPPSIARPSAASISLARAARGEHRLGARALERRDGARGAAAHDRRDGVLDDRHGVVVTREREERIDGHAERGARERRLGRLGDHVLGVGERATRIFCAEARDRAVVADRARRHALAAEGRVVRRERVVEAAELVQHVAAQLVEQPQRGRELDAAIERRERAPAVTGLAARERLDLEAARPAERLEARRERLGAREIALVDAREGLVVHRARFVFLLPDPTCDLATRAARCASSRTPAAA